MNLWLDAEDAYFTNARNYGPGDYVRLEVLESSTGGSAVYLQEPHMDGAGRAGYRSAVQGLRPRAQDLTGRVLDHASTMTTVVACFDHVLADLG